MRNRRQKAKGGRRKANLRRAFSSALCLLLIAYCSLLPAMAQYGTAPPSSQPGNVLPAELSKVGIDQRLGNQIPLDLAFRDETGRSVQLKEYFNSRPVILSLVFYECPMLCHQVLNGLVGSLEGVAFNVGKEFEVVTISFDRRERPELATATKASYLKRYGRRDTAHGWHFLTGDQESIDRLTEAVGFRYTYDPVKDQFAHASGIMVLTPEGKLSHYFYGIEYAPRELRLSLVEASANKIGSPVDQLLLYCFHYDPATGKYGPIIMSFVRLGGVLTILLTVGLLLVLERRRGLWKERIVGGETT